MSHPFNDLEQDQKNLLESSAEASRTAYYPQGTIPWYESRKLIDRGYFPLDCCSEKAGVFTVGWYNEISHNLIVAHRGTNVNNPDNLFSDLGIVEAAVRVDTGNAALVPDHRSFTKVLTSLVQQHIGDFLGNSGFTISDLSSAEKIIVDRILNFDRLYNSVINTYQTGGGIVGVLGAGALTIAAATAPPLALVGLAVSALSGGGAGNLYANRVINGYLSEGRSTLSRTIDIMYENTKALLMKAQAKRRGDEVALTVTGHSLGGAGALGVTAKFESDGYPNLDSVLFNAPGGHSGVSEIWNEHSAVNVNPATTSNIYSVKRQSCIVSRLGTNPSSKDYVFAPLPHQGVRSISEWRNILLPSHSMDALVADIFPI
jgi:hypothetical protein